MAESTNPRPFSTCPTCAGTGRITNTEFNAALSQMPATDSSAPSGRMTNDEYNNAMQNLPKK